MNLKWPEDFVDKIICGDCREVMKQIPNGVILSIITDPIWPNAKNIFDVNDPWKLLNDALVEASRFTERVVIQLGLDSDPRFLTAVPSRYEYVKSFSLRYAVPNHKGRILYDRDIAYFFGKIPSSIPGRRLLTSQTLTADNTGKSSDHPCPRKLSHVKYLVWQCTDENDIILDPFMGSGTTAVAAKQLGRSFIGIEVNPEYCAIAEDRLRQEELFNGEYGKERNDKVRVIGE